MNHNWVKGFKFAVTMQETFKADLIMKRISIWFESQLVVWRLKMFQKNIQMHQHSNSRSPIRPIWCKFSLTKIICRLWRKVESFSSLQEDFEFIIIKWVSNYVATTRFLLSNLSPSCVAKLCRLIEICCNIWPALTAAPQTLISVVSEQFDAIKSMMSESDPLYFHLMRDQRLKPEQELNFPKKTW